ncbi:MAG: UvrD-helicase domain-containing protein, partial [Salinispira sp.]
IITRLLEQFSYEKIVRELFIRLGSTFLSLTQVGGTHGASGAGVGAAGGGNTNVPHGASGAEKDGSASGAEKDGSASAGKDETIGQAEIFFDLLHDLARRELITLQRTIPEILHVNAQEQNNAQNKEHHREAMNTCSRCLTELGGMITAHAADAGSIAAALIEVLQPAVAALYFLAGSRSSRKPWKHWKELCTKIRTILIPALLIFTEQEFYTEFYELADDYLRRVREFKRKRGVFYYRDLLELSIRILLDHPALADYYRKEIQHIMIDEFQDNNVLQKNLLFLLSAPQGYRAPEIPNFSQLRAKGLFLVGDQKQSIYRFRGADVSVFRKLGREFHTESTILSLNTNYRSSRDLIDFFNHFFPRIMGGREDFEADYSPLEIGRSASIASHIELILHRERKKTDLTEHNNPLLSRQEMEAYSIAKRIYEICNDDTLLKQAGDAVTPVSYDDIAILFRSGTIQYLIEKMLRRFDIPFSSDSIRSLFLDAPAFDAHALLKLCIFPEDSFSLAAVLRSPFCRLGDDTIAALLFQLADGRLSSGEKIPLHDQSAHSDQSAHQDQSAHADQSEQSGSENAMRGIMSFEDVSAYNALLDFLDDIRSLIGHCSHSELLAEMWKRSAYLDYVDFSPRRRTWLEHYDYLLEFFDLHADVPLVELLEIMEANLGKFGKIEDISIVQEKKCGVSIMSVHKAKGLEFPVVFLVNTNGKERNSTEASASWVSGKNGELILYGGLGRAASAKYLKDDPGMSRSFRNPLVKQYENDECERENAETRRILYVAMTRAEQHLFISASGIKNSRKERSQTEPAREWNENFFDLIQAGMNLNPEEILQQGPLYRSEQRTEAGSIFLTLPEPVGRNDLQPIHSAPDAGDFSGPARQLPLPPMPRTHFSVNEMQKFQLSKDHTADGEDHHTEAQNTIGGTDGNR